MSNDYDFKAAGQKISNAIDRAVWWARIMTIWMMLLTWIVVYLMVR
jgi:hypothetical protein